MKRRHFLSLAACCLLGLLPGCSFPMTDNMQVEDLLRAPRLSGDYGALQSALNDWLGESAQLKYPMQGELLSPFLLQDLDGDGEQDAAVLYTTAQSSNVCIAFLQKDAAGAWKVQQTIEGLADTVDNVRLAQLQDGNAVQLVVGYLAAQGDSYLAVYSYEHGEVNAILEQSYEQYLVEDITGGGNEDLILMSTLEDGGVQIELLTVNRDGSFQQVAVMGLSADKFSGCASVASGLGADGRHYLVLDGWTGISGNNLATVLLRFDEESQQMIPAEQISASALYSASLRNVPNLVSRDLDGDGTVEIKSVAREAGSRSKIAVYSDNPKIDPVGSCVGQKGARVANVLKSLGNEKIDIVKYHEDPVEYITESLSPAKVLSVTINEEEKSAEVVVPDFQLSLAIGKEGQNARLAAKLTGWKIDIKSDK